MATTLPGMLLLVALASVLTTLLCTITWRVFPPPPPRSGSRPPSPVAAPLPSRSTWSWSLGGMHEAQDPVMAGMRAVWQVLFGVVVLVAVHPFVALPMIVVDLYLQRCSVDVQHPHAGTTSGAAAGLAPLLLTYAPAMVGWMHSRLSYSGGGWLDVLLVFSLPMTAHVVMMVGEQVTDVSLKTMAVDPTREATQRVARMSAAVTAWRVGGCTVLSLLQAVLAGVCLAVRGALWPLYAAVVLSCVRLWVQGMADALDAKARLVASLAAHLD